MGGRTESPKMKNRFEMFNWRIVSLILLIVIAIVTSQDLELLARPIRPEKFTSHGELQDYLQKLKAYHLQNGHRYGKRFYAPAENKLQKQFLPENWQDIYEIVKHYEDN
ncbi:pro-neuropeptide Y-like isoform X2 [Photinus pyralis]|uniref:pro-neuropeptide Y-like isoform X2 n=1 Tax=Photinus pyralis TaxID=7054 RepID=UPI00126705F5|nr:pro-neuropeptide Y-like isoform X2 [Photinus pyralis]